MPDGHVNKCKACNKADVIANRASKVDKYRAYDRERGNRQDAENTRRYRAENPKKYAAHQAVAKATKNGSLVKQVCEICADANTVAHHCDYDQPLSVSWLCSVHHFAWHTQHGEGLNA